MSAFHAATALLPHPPLNFLPVAPEMALFGAGVLVMLVDALWPRLRQELFAAISLVGIAIAAGFAVAVWSWHGPRVVLGGMVAADRFSAFFAFVLLGSTIVAVLLSVLYLGRSGEGRGEYYALLLFAAAGMTLIVAADDLILVFIALEILSLALYLLTGFSFRRIASAEASMKYFLLGAFSSAFFLYGVALAYGAAGTTSLAGIAHALTAHATSPIALFAAGLLATGFFFKIAAVPFHMWTPDAYQGAPTCVTAFMSAGTKVAAFGAFLRVFTVAFRPIVTDWRPIVAAVAIATMVVGSLLAVAQSDIKRMLAYSSIASAGFILVGASAASPAGTQAAMYYLAAYAAMVLGAFGVVILVSARGERHTSLASYRGLSQRSPLLAALLALFLLSLAGIPPTGGFVAKVVVFGAAIRGGYWPVVLVGVLASVIAAFVYLRIIVLMYMQDPADVERVPGAPVPVGAIAILGIFTLAIGVFPGIIFGMLKAASVARF